MRVVALLLLLAGTPAIAADQFDLACEGKKWTQRGTEGVDDRFRLRIDLAAKKWCEGDCKTVQNVFSVSDDKLVLTDDSTLNTRLEAFRLITVERKTGVFIHHYTQQRPEEQLLYIDAGCKTEAFTPFPAG
jgi:hypothetical protein